MGRFAAVDRFTRRWSRPASGRRRPQQQRPGQAHPLRWSRPHGDRRAVRRGPRAGRRSRSGRSNIDEAMASAIVAWRWLTTKSTAGKAQFES
jgi:hypothetical protein